MNSPPSGRWPDAPPRYPDPAVVVLDERFAPLRVGNAVVERVATGCRWAEGPVWFGDHHCLVWSDIPNDRMLRWDERTGQTTVFRQPSGNVNGNTRDRRGRLVSCEHLARRVTRTEPDGSLTVLATDYGDHRLNSPNDVIVASDGGVWFSDPTYGIGADYEGLRAESELPTAVYRVDPETRHVQRMITGLVQPNGLCLSPDESVLYVVDSGSSPRSIHAFAFALPDTVGERTLFAEIDPGGYDGIRCDERGNVWAATSGGEGVSGVQVMAPDGTPIGRILLPESCSNVCFGGPVRNRLFMTASQSVYAVYVNTRGC